MALEFGVPLTMLKDRVSGRIIPNSNPGRQPYLSREEEKELMDFFISCSRLDYGLIFCL